MDDFLLVDTDGRDSKGGRSFSFWGVPTVATRNRASQLLPGVDPVEVDPPDPAPPNPPRPPLPPSPPTPRERRSSPLPFRSVVAPSGDRKLRAVIASHKDFSEAWLTLRMDENTDVTCDRIWPDEPVSITSLTMRAANDVGQSIKTKIIANGKAVAVPGFAENTSYDVEIGYQLPRDLAGSVGTPVFRLELHRPPNSSKPQGRAPNANNT